MNHDDRNKKGGARRSRALVLGAGGPIGRIWQSGLIAGLIEREIDLGDASLIIGTSAGAIVGAQLPHRGAAMLDGRLGPDAFRIGYAQALQEAEDIRLTWNS